MEFKNIKTGFLVTFYRPETGAERLTTEERERWGENRKMILKLMKENKHITILELSEKLNISTTAVEKNIKYLRKNKLIERIGPDKGGHWEVIK